jgi:hypothetical protein
MVFLFYHALLFEKLLRFYYICNLSHTHIYILFNLRDACVFSTHLIDGILLFSDLLLGYIRHFMHLPYKLTKNVPFIKESFLCPFMFVTRRRVPFYKPSVWFPREMAGKRGGI